MIHPLLRAYAVAYRDLLQAIGANSPIVHLCRVSAGIAEGRWGSAGCPIDAEPGPATFVWADGKVIPNPDYPPDPTDPDPPSAYPVGGDCDGGGE